MATLLIRVLPVPSPSSEQCEQVGDIIDVFADDVLLTGPILAMPCWRIIRFTNITIDDAKKLLSTVAVEPWDHRLPPFRASGLDLFDSSWPLEESKYLADNSRTVSIFESHLTFDKLKITNRFLISNPKVIG